MARVLVVDHEGRIRTMLADVLRASGYNVSVARSGFEAIEIASAIAPDLVMLGVQMPAMDGWATLELLRMERPSPRVLMMSGNDDAALAAARGAEAFLWKPYHPADVLREVANAMGETPGQPSRRAA